MLILHKYDLAKSPYRSWVGPDAHLTLFCPDSALVEANGSLESARTDFDEIVRFGSVDEYASSGLVELEAIQRHAVAPFDRVIAVFEFDVRRAAQLREVFGAAGQLPVSATAYRDKYVMKSRLSGAGIPVADFYAVDTPSDLVRAFDSLGPKIVVKPRWGAGSVGMCVLDNPTALRSYIATKVPVNEDRPANLLAERFIEHEMHHVDGFVADGRLVFASASGMSPLVDFRDGTKSFSNGATTFSAIHDWNSPIYRDLVELTSKAVSALPTYHHGIIHAEVFQTRDGTLIFNEIAARVGGLRIRKTVQESFGVDLVECAVHAQMDRAVSPLFDEVRDGPKRLAGWAAFPGTKGRLVQIRQEHPFEWVVEYQVRAQPGDSVCAAEGCTDHIATVVVVGSTSSEVGARLREFDAWFWQGTHIESSGNTGG